MGLLDNLYHRTLAPGDLPFRRAAGVVQARTLDPAVYGMRVEIPRVARRLLPYALDIESGIGEGNVGRQIIRGYLPAPKYPAAPRPPVYTPPIYQYPPGVTPPPGTPPPGGVPPGGTLPPGILAPPLQGPLPPGQEWPTPAAPGYRRAWNFQFTADTGGSDPAQEIRVSPAIGNPFRVTEIEITPLAGVVVGQYIDILVCANADMSDAGAFFGSSVFENLSMLGDVPPPDNQRGIAVPLQTKRFEDLGPVFAAGQQVKVVVFFTAPAAAMPLVSVSVVTEEVVFSTALPPPRLPPDYVPPYAQPPTLPPYVPPGTPPSPVVPGEPPGVLPMVPAPTYALVTVVFGWVDVMNMVARYDLAGHIVGYVQDPAQAALWEAARAAERLRLGSQGAVAA